MLIRNLFTQRIRIPNMAMRQIKPLQVEHSQFSFWKLRCIQFKRYDKNMFSCSCELYCRNGLSIISICSFGCPLTFDFHDLADITTQIC